MWKHITKQKSVKGNVKAHHREKGLLKVKCESTSQSKKKHIFKADKVNS